MAGKYVDAYSWETGIANLPMIGLGVSVVAPCYRDLEWNWSGHVFFSHGGIQWDMPISVNVMIARFVVNILLYIYIDIGSISIYIYICILIDPTYIYVYYLFVHLFIYRLICWRSQKKDPSQVKCMYGWMKHYIKEEVDGGENHKAMAQIHATFW